MDKITRKMGFPVGSATLMDKVGIDVAAKISEYLGKELGSRLGDSAAMVSILKEMVSKGMLGKFHLIFFGSTNLEKICPGLPQHRENRECGCSFFQTGKTQRICQKILILFLDREFTSNTEIFLSLKN